MFVTSVPVAISCMVRPTVFKLRSGRVVFQLCLSIRLVFNLSNICQGLGARNLVLGIALVAALLILQPA